MNLPLVLPGGIYHNAMQKLVSPFSMEHRAAHARESHQRRRLHGWWPVGGSLEGGQSVQQRSRRGLSLLAVIATVSAFALLGCVGDKEHDNPATASDLNNRAFTFPSGTVFDPALTNVPTVLSFANNATTFALHATVQNLVHTATGTYGASTGSCRLPIGNSLDPNASSGGSDFPTGTGPQPGKTINLVICDFDRTKNTLTVFDGT